MKVALVRHFKVAWDLPGKMFITPKELSRWFAEYEASDVEVKDVSLAEVKWEKCFSSDLLRAIKTAESIFLGEVIKMKELREIRPVVPINKEIRLPFLLYPLLLKAAWLVDNKSQTETKTDVEKRAKAVLDEILSNGQAATLVVSHANFMKFMRKELLYRGFEGPKFKTAENGKVYIYER